ncbi:MAG: protocatechuate 3,4-dioxygenase subunit alpha [Pseudomonadota bacterium]
MTPMADDFKETPSQTAGPFVHIGLAPGAAGFDIYEAELGHDIAGPHAQGERIRVEGIVFDGDGEPIKDVMIEVWQANAQGHYATRGNNLVEQGFRGWGRVIPDFETGEWAFETVKPGGVARHDDRQQAPHMALWLVARGMNVGLHTRLYFDDEAAANAVDPVLHHLKLQGRDDTLIAARRPVGGIATYRFDIHLQGQDETVFFDV